MSFRWKATACCVVAAFALDHSGAAAQQPIVASAVVRQDYEALAQQIYQSPSDLDVSFKFAEQAVARGD